MYVDTNILEKHLQPQRTKFKDEYLIKKDKEESSHGLKRAHTIPALVWGD